MSNHEHERALELIMRRGSEELAVRDLEWLNTHLAACSECAAYAEDFDQTGHLGSRSCDGRQNLVTHRLSLSAETFLSCGREGYPLVSWQPKVVFISGSAVRAYHPRILRGCL